MSRGPGHIERTIADTFASNSDKTFSVRKLCEMVWPGINRIEHKHRVSVIRAAERITNKSNWTKCSFPDWTPHRGAVVFIGPKDIHWIAKFEAAKHWVPPSKADVRNHILFGSALSETPEGFGLSNKLIAIQLTCSVSTARRHTKAAKAEDD